MDKRKSGQYEDDQDADKNTGAATGSRPGTRMPPPAAHEQPNDDAGDGETDDAYQDVNPAQVQAAEGSHVIGKLGGVPGAVGGGQREWLAEASHLSRGD